ncbi:MAG TPA: hypothetical protein VNT92_02730 [Acidimicrobiia bacterium]|nr:hypothetical protein [Acidimicrobiia bacterium]
MRRNVVGTVLITLLIVGALGAIGFGLWQMGYQRGLVETGTEVVTRTVNGIHGWWGPGFGFGGFGFFGLFFKVLLFFLLFGLIARLFFGPRRWGGPGPYWGRGWHEGQGSPVEQHMTEWHDRAHGNPPNPKPETEQDT